MSQSTTHPWKKAAFETLLWLLDAETSKAEKAYQVLFSRLVEYFRSNRFDDPEDLAVETLERVAKIVYLKLTGLQLHQLDDLWVRHEVPRGIAPELYETERERLTGVALLTARRIAIDAARRSAPALLDHRNEALSEFGRNTFEEEVIEELTNEGQVQLLYRILADLPTDDRRLILSYYNAHAGEAQSRQDLAKKRRDLAKELGITPIKLSSRVSSIRDQIRSKIKRAERPSGAVRFTAYYPRSLGVENWSTVLAYMHVADAIMAVQTDSLRRLGDKDQTARHKTVISEVSIARGARIIVVPQSDELEFNPPQVAFTWLEDYHCVEFRCRVRGNETTPHSAAVSVAFFVVPILAAEISFTVRIGPDSERKERRESVSARPYQRVFVSYSHRDNAIVDQLEKAYKALGIDYLRDVRMLRSGETWQPALLQRIDESEIFQLLWSRAAKRSVYVRREWEHALTLHRSLFIRPVYWDRPMPPPPKELADIHFAYLELQGNRP